MDKKKAFDPVENGKNEIDYNLLFTKIPFQRNTSQVFMFEKIRGLAGPCP